MASPSVARLAEDSMTYIRWPSDNPNCLVEFSAEAFDEISREIEGADRAKTEIGGFLLGTMTGSATPAFRIEHFKPVAANSAESSIYMLGPLQQEQFAAATQRAASGATVPVGYFRSHLRSGPLTLSLADKGFLWKQFKSASYVTLLIDAHPPHKAVLSVWVNGRMDWQSSAPAFPFEEKPPEVISEPEPPSPVIPDPVRGTTKRGLGTELVALFAVLTFALGVILWPLWEATFGGPWAVASPDDMVLAVEQRGPDLNVRWNGRMPEVSRAQGAVLTIIDGPHQRQVQLGKNDLRFGSVAYLPKTQKVKLSLALQMNDSTELVQSAVWQAR